jgi:hypothetical protein
MTLAVTIAGCLTGGNVNGSVSGDEDNLIQEVQSMILECKGSSEPNFSGPMTVAGTSNALVIHEEIIGSPDDQETVVGCKGLPLEPTQLAELKKFTWRVERPAASNYRRLGQRLAEARGGLYRNHANCFGLIQVMPDGKTLLITKGSELAPIIVDRVKVRVMKEGKLVSELPTSTHLNAMLRSEAFLQQFLPLDEVATHPFYLNDFSLAKPGYTDGGPGERVLYVGPEPEIADSTATIEQFLDMMDFETNADRTNAIAAALTVVLRHRWLGEKPLILVTGTKSHCGKGTVTDFIRGSVAKADILYERNDWPMQSQLQRQLHLNPDIGMIVFDNVRTDSAGGGDKFIRSGFIKSFVTNAEIMLASPGAGPAIRLENRFVATINANEGKFSTDIVNRGLTTHLAPRGSVLDRPCNPKLDFLPKHHERIAAELHGMIARWRAAGCPLNYNVQHSMKPWARVIGGIVKVSGFKDFLANSAARKSADDPIGEALAILGAAKPGKELRPQEWARHAMTQGLAKTLFPPNERDTDKGRERAIGVVLKRHLDETFTAQIETKTLRLRLEGGLKRWVKGKNPHVRYVFTVLEETERVTDDEASASKGTAVEPANA